MKEIRALTTKSDFLLTRVQATTSSLSFLIYENVHLFIDLTFSNVPSVTVWVTWIACPEKKFQHLSCVLKTRKIFCCMTPRLQSPV